LIMRAIQVPSDKRGSPQGDASFIQEASRGASDEVYKDQASVKLCGGEPQLVVRLRHFVRLRNVCRLLDVSKNGEQSRPWARVYHIEDRICLWRSLLECWLWSRLTFGTTAANRTAFPS